MPSCRFCSSASARASEIFSACEVLEEHYLDDVVVFRVRATPADIDRLRAA
jgi:hypothetical protein